MKKATVIGIGRLGLCYALNLEDIGYNVVGVDIRQDYVDQLNEGKIDTNEPKVENYLQKSRNFYATTDLREGLDHSDLIFVVVKTSSLDNGRYDHSQIYNIIDDIKSFGVSDKIKDFVVCATTMPQECDKFADKLNDYNYRVSYNPEFIAQGSIIVDQQRPEIVLIGEADECAGDRIEDVYHDMCDNDPPIHRMSRTEAEITKIGLNCFCTTKISFANMLGDIVLESGGDPDVVLDAIGDDSRVGKKYLNYGFGYGGPCFPRDNRALAIYAEEDLNTYADISKATDNVNRKHLLYQVDKYLSKTRVDGGMITMPYVTYKKGVDILEESQQLAFARIIAKSGWRVIVQETKDVISKLKEKYGDLFEYEERK